jgi:hypothetical protein
MMVLKNQTIKIMKYETICRAWKLFEDENEKFFVTKRSRTDPTIHDKGK